MLIRDSEVRIVKFKVRQASHFSTISVHVQSPVPTHHGDNVWSTTTAAPGRQLAANLHCVDMWNQHMSCNIKDVKLNMAVQSVWHFQHCVFYALCCFAYHPWLNQLPLLLNSNCHYLQSNFCIPLQYVLCSVTILLHYLAICIVFSHNTFALPCNIFFITCFFCNTFSGPLQQREWASPDRSRRRMKERACVFDSW